MVKDCVGGGTDRALYEAVAFGPHDRESGAGRSVQESPGDGGAGEQLSLDTGSGRPAAGGTDG